MRANGERGEHGETRASEVPAGVAIPEILPGMNSETTACSAPGDDFYDRPCSAHELIEHAPSILEEKRLETREDLFESALDVYRRVLSSSDPKTFNAQLGAARDVLSDTGPFASRGGSPPYPSNMSKEPPAAISRLVNAMLELSNGTVIAIKDMKYERQDSDQ